MFTISVIVGSAVLYRDFESADAERVGKFIGGCMLTFLGVYFITSGRSSDDGPESEEAGENVDQGINLLDEEDHVEGLDGSVTPTPLEEESPRRSRGVGSRHGSQQSRSRPAALERIGSIKSAASQTFTPPEMDPESPLVENPWAESRGSLQSRQFQSRNTTTSSMPTDNSEPATPRKGARPRLAGSSVSHRRSIADIFPGPISSPLSSSFSGVVADARRKDIDHSSKTKQSRIALLKSRSSGLHVQQSQEALRQEQSPAADADTEGTPTKPRPKRARSQSLGNALGSLFRRPSKRPPDEEGGPHERQVEDSIERTDIPHQ